MDDADARDPVPDDATPGGARLLLACLLGPLAAVLLYLPTVTHGTWLEDDVYLANLVDDWDATPATDWDKVLADFTRPWATDRGMFYRPVVTLSAGVEYALAGGPSATLSHATNLAVHALAALCCALLAAALRPRGRVTAAAMGGLLFALHPAASEPVCWLAARTSSFAIAFQLVALAAFTRHRLRGSRPALVLCGLACALAYTSKEEAVVTPAVLLLWDLVLGTVHGGGPRWRSHLALAPVWLAYWGARRVALGEFWLGGEQPALSAGDAARHLVDKLGVAAAPVTEGLPGWVVVVLAGAPAVALVAALLTRRGPARAALALAWCALAVLPSLPYAQSPHLAGSRYVYGGAAAVVVLAASGLATRPALLRRALPAVLLAWCAALAVTGHARVGEYLDGFASMDAVRTELADALEQTAVERPLAVLSAPLAAAGIPSVRASSLFALAERPLASRDHALVSLLFLFYRTPRSVPLWNDAGPLRALLELGAQVVGWSNARETFDVLRPARRPDAPVPLVAADDGRLALPPDVVVSPGGVEAVRLVTLGPARGGTLRWVVRPPDRDEIVGEPVRFEGPYAEDGHVVFVVDLSSDWAFSSASFLGPLAGFRVELDDPRSRLVAASALPRVDVLPLTQVLADRVLVPGEESSVLRAPELPRDGLSLHLVVLGPDRGYTTRVTPGAPVTFPDDVRLPLERLRFFSRQARFYYYFVARPAPGRSVPGARSPVDWFRLARR